MLGVRGIRTIPHRPCRFFLPMNTPKTDIAALTEAIRNDRQQKFINLVNNGADIFAHDTEGHSLMWHARQSSNPLFADTLKLLASGKEFSELPPPAAPAKAEEPATSPEPESTPAPLPRVLNKEEKQDCLQSIRAKLLISDILSEKEKQMMQQFSLSEFESIINAKDKKGFTLLARAVEAKDALLCKDLLMYGAEYSRGWFISECLVVILSHPIKYRDFLNEHPSGDSVMLKRAVELKKQDIAKLICEFRPMAKSQWRLDQLLYEALTKYIREQDEQVRILIDLGANTRNGFYGIPPIILAAKDGHFEIIKLLLEHGADADSRDSSGRNPLMLCHSNPEMVKLLIEHGADVNARDTDGNTPLHYAAEASVDIHDDFRTAEYLRAHGADFNMPNNKGRMPKSIFLMNMLRIPFSCVLNVLGFVFLFLMIYGFWNGFGYAVQKYGEWIIKYRGEFAILLSGAALWGLVRSIMGLRKVL